MEAKDFLVWVQLANLCLVPLLVSFYKIERKLTRLVVLMAEHEKADKDKFESLFEFKKDWDRRGRDQLLGRGGS